MSLSVVSKIRWKFLWKECSRFAFWCSILIFRRGILKKRLKLWTCIIKFMHNNIGPVCARLEKHTSLARKIVTSVIFVSYVNFCEMAAQSFDSTTPIPQYGKLIFSYDLFFNTFLHDLIFRKETTSHYR